MSTDYPPSTSTSTVNPPRPPNAWILFRSDKLKTLAPSTPARSQGEVSRLIASMWRNLPDTLRAHYDHLAEQKKIEHQKLYPDYRFKPKKKEEKIREREEARQKKDMERNGRKGRRVERRNTVAPIPSLSTPLTYAAPAECGDVGPSPSISLASTPADSFSSPATPASHSDLPPTCTPMFPASFPPFPHPSGSSSPIPPLPFSLTAATPSQYQSQPSGWQGSLSEQLQAQSWEAPTAAAATAFAPQDSAPVAQIPTLTFELPQSTVDNVQTWLQSTGDSQLFESFQSLLASDDPSIFQLHDLDHASLASYPDGEIEISMGALQGPDLCSLLIDTTTTTFDFGFMDPLHNAHHTTNPFYIPDLNPPTQTFNSDDFINFDGVDTAEGVAPSAAYIPPSGASMSSTRRVAGSWKPNMLSTESSLEISAS